jgi:hypothetical protein
MKNFFRIPDFGFGTFWTRTRTKTKDPGSRFRDKKCWIQIRDEKLFESRSGGKHPGSATLKEGNRLKNRHKISLIHASVFTAEDCMVLGPVLLISIQLIAENK